MTTRREVLLGCGALCLAAACDEEPELPAIIDAGNASSLAQGSVTALSGGPAAIARDASGIYALSLICTHAGCDIRSGGSVSSGAIICGCHGSKFDRDGAVLTGPATSPLPHLAVTEDAQGELTVHGDQPVPATTRI